MNYINSYNTSLQCFPTGP